MYVYNIYVYIFFFLYKFNIFCILMRQILFKELFPILNQATAYKPKWFVFVLTVFRVLLVKQLPEYRYFAADPQNRRAVVIAVTEDSKS